MSLLLTALLFAVLHDPLSPGDPNLCRCATVSAADGWCGKCRLGYYAGQRVDSLTLFEVIDIHGHEVFADKTRCAACRDAMRDGGFCDACNMGYINGRGFFSRVCYHLAKGRIAPQPATRPACCRGGNGWCATCNTGIVGNRVFTDRGDYDDARRGFEVLSAALREAKRCDTCAMAMITDSYCHVCRAEFKSGKRISTPAAHSPTTSAPGTK